jgi:dienelactone hydrolase
LFFTLTANATRLEALLPTGKIIEKVACRADATLSYALYVPSNYDSKTGWPVLFAFDPGARGLLPVEHFKEAAEAYGYIVAGSNNSRNGPWAPSVKAITAMWNDVVERIAIDQRRVYLAGFSGGARVACHLGSTLKTPIAGVIACGGGFPPETAPSQSIPFVLFGTAGVEDFNYVEMKQLDRTLDELGKTHRVEVFEGGHAWAPPELCIRALEWMELQAMRSAIRGRSEPLIDTLFKKEVERARALEGAGSVYQAYAAYSGIAETFQGLRDVSEFQRKAAGLKEGNEVRQALKLEKEQEAEQRRRSVELYRLRVRLNLRARPGQSDELDAGVAAPRYPTQNLDEEDDRAIALADLKRAVADLKKRSEAKESTPDRALARRLLNQFVVASIERSMALLDRKDYVRASENLALEAEIMPDNWRVLYYLACAYSLKGDKKKAIDVLKKSLQKGFSNPGLLEGDKSFDSIREEAGFKRVVEELKAKK